MRRLLPLAIAAAVVTAPAFATETGSVTGFGEIKPATIDNPPKRMVWKPHADPLALKVIAWFESRDPLDASAVDRTFDSQGFAWLTEEREMPISDPAVIGKGIKALANVVRGFDGETEILDIRRIEDNHIAMITRTKAIQYMNPEARQRPVYYVDFRNVFILREVENGFRIVYQVEAPVSPITYLWRFHEQMAKEYQDEIKVRDAAAAR